MEEEKEVVYILSNGVHFTSIKMNRFVCLSCTAFGNSCFKYLFEIAIYLIYYIYDFLVIIIIM